MTLPITAFSTRAALMGAAADRLEAALKTAITARGKACAMLSGGSTPEPTYRELATRNVDWAHVTFGLVDERFVPPNSADSNEGMLMRALKRPLSQGAVLPPMWCNGLVPQQAAERADALYREQSIDIAVMGMGADGHTASWFPGATGLREALDPQSTRTVVALNAPEAAGSADRISLTLAALARADKALLLITGADKRAKLEASLRQTPETAPVVALIYAMADRLQILWAE